jgi:addiction module HigA family antidote
MGEFWDSHNFTAFDTDAPDAEFDFACAAPVHPGEILLEEFLLPMGISQYRLAKDISVHPRRINEIVHGNRAISADTALRLSRYFGLSERFWMNLQARYDLESEKDRLAGRLEQEVKVLAASPAVAIAEGEAKYNA